VEPYRARRADALINVGAHSDHRVNRQRKDEHRYLSTKYWRAGLIRYKHIVIEISPGPYGNVLSAKIAG